MNSAILIEQWISNFDLKDINYCFEQAETASSPDPKKEKKETTDSPIVHQSPAIDDKKSKFNKTLSLIGKQQFKMSKKKLDLKAIGKLETNTSMDVRRSTFSVPKKKQSEVHLPTKKGSTSHLIMVG